ncbi:hypothetical protein BUPH_05246 [Paraburkholderia phenoliruptrix BR3459a]|uniref:Uncharacterized protein n=1 Tax=Paraburkholderia phenoliruptrix BR3459a TaxID=1229205 RepID=K0DJZ1_9BURK|nr:hypothetical protein BUPH_05246 [Paraburkholderia phenoliruptrix BR3459a]
MYRVAAPNVHRAGRGRRLAASGRVRRRLRIPCPPLARRLRAGVAPPAQQRRQRRQPTDSTAANAANAANAGNAGNAAATLREPVSGQQGF